jgi:PAS domain S-box-containing protein
MDRMKGCLCILLVMLGSIGSCREEPRDAAVALPHQFPRDRIRVGLSHPRSARGLIFGRVGDASGAMGFAPQITVEAAGLVGLSVEFVAVHENDDERALDRGEIDAVCVLSITDARAERYAFTQPLMISRGAVYALEGTPRADEAEELRRSRVAVAVNGIAQEWCRRLGITARATASLQDSFDAVASGDADYVVTTMPAGRVDLKRREDRRRFREWELKDQSLSRAFAIAAKPANHVLINDLNKGLAALRDSGRFDELYDALAGEYQPKDSPGFLTRRTALLVAGTAVAIILGVTAAYIVTRRALTLRNRDLRIVSGQRAVLHREIPALVFTVLIRRDGTRALLHAGNEAQAWTRRFPTLVVGQHWEESIKEGMHPDEMDHFSRIVRSARESGSSVTLEFRIRDNRGEYRWLMYRADPEPHPEGTVWNALLLDVNDVHTLRHRAAAFENRSRILVESVPAAIILFRPDDEVIIEANRVAADLYQTPLERLVGSSLRVFSTNPEEGVRAIASTLREGRFHGEFVQKLPDGRVVNIECIARVIDLDGERLILTINQDITALIEARTRARRLEADLEAARHMEMLGVMAGGVAHDFNNLLVGILGNAGLARRQTHDPAALAETLGRIEEAGRFAADLVRRLSEEVGAAPVPSQRLDLAVLAAEVISALGPRIAEGLSVQRSGDPAHVLADPVAVKQAVLNLITNASDAMVGRPGVIRVRTGIRKFDPGADPGCAVGSSLAPGVFAFVSVEDSGSGIPPEVHSRMFEPFVSSKAAGRGLGLTLVLASIRRTGGAVCVRSNPEAGTWFELLWPAHRAAPSASEPVMEPRHTARGAVLIIEDNPAVRDTAAAMIRALGSAALLADTGEEGLALLERHRPVAVLLDVTLPGISGWEVLERIRVRAPGVRVILSTGYDATAVRRSVQPDAFLPKPYALDQLREALGLTDAARSASSQVEPKPSTTTTSLGP